MERLCKKIYFSYFFQGTIDSEPLLLEAFGPCLPNAKAAEVFLEKCKESD